MRMGLHGRAPADNRRRSKVRILPRLQDDRVAQSKHVSSLFRRRNPAMQRGECRWNYIAITTGSRVRLPPEPREGRCSSAVEQGAREAASGGILGPAVSSPFVATTLFVQVTLVATALSLLVSCRLMSGALEPTRTRALTGTYGTVGVRLRCIVPVSSPLKGDGRGEGGNAYRSHEK